MRLGEREARKRENSKKTKQKQNNWRRRRPAGEPRRKRGRGRDNPWEKIKTKFVRVCEGEKEGKEN